MSSSSPFDSSPFSPSHSPRLFWQGRESQSSFQSLNSENTKPYDPEVSYSPTKRPSIENLKRASRVKNSNIFAREQNQEYDPAHVVVLDRPLATGRPFHGQSPGSPARQSGHDRMADTETSPRHNSPSKGQASPAKSSLSKGARFGGKPFDPESEIWSDAEGLSPKRFADDQAQSRQAKSVTFDAAPPQVNEYEMTTPDPSSIASESREGSYESDEDEADMSFDRGSSLDRDDSFDASLEDIEKTPVVLPEDWRFMSPASANDDLVQGEEDPFMEEHGSPNPEALPASSTGLVTRQARVESFDSNGERRPLPPLPSSKLRNQSPHLTPPTKLSAAFELGSSGQRVLPSPGPAQYSKTDITGMGRGSMTLEDRLRLMMLQEQDQESPQSEADRQRERRMRRAGAREKSGVHLFESKEESQNDSNLRTESEPALHDVSTPPHISRESILQNIKNTHDMSYDELYEYSSPPSAGPTHLSDYDPDVPLPSLEDRLDEENGMIVKEEQSDDEDLYAIPEFNDTHAHESTADDTELDDDDESHYSRNSKEELHRFSSGSGDGQTTPVPSNRTEEMPGPDHSDESDRPQTAIPRSSLDKESLNAKEKPSFDMSSIRNAFQRPMTPEGQSGDFEEDPSTPESVIRHPVEDDEYSDEEPVPELLATIKAPGTGLRTRPSLTPADMNSMAAVRRKVSAQSQTMSSVSETASYCEDMSTEEEQAQSDERPSEEVSAEAPSLDVPQRQSSLVKLDIPLSNDGESLGFGLDKEFDRVIEAQKVAFELALSQKRNPFMLQTQDMQPQAPGGAEHIGGQGFTPTGALIANKHILKQRGYLMRQNTKVIIASSRNDDEPQSANPDTESDASATKAADSSPRKASQPTWTAEPWNGKIRRQSVRLAGGVKKKPVGGAVPPLPGIPSNVQDVQSGIDEIESHPAIEPLEEGQERGRLFVKVVGVRDLDLPFPRGERFVIGYLPL
jgi:hypothetical protein